MTTLNVILTIVIAGAAAVQAVFAWRLWQLQDSIETRRSQTFVSLALDIRQIQKTPQDPPNRPILRLENGSGVGIVVTKILLRVTAPNAQTAGPEVSKPLNFAIGPYSMKECDVYNFLHNQAMAVDSQNPAWNGQPHSADVRIEAVYRAEGRELRSELLRGQLHFQATHFDKMEYA